MEVFTTNSAEETKRLAPKVLKNLKTNVIGLIGELGSGKTTFVQGVAQALGVKKRVISPSFILIRQYETKIFNLQFSISNLFHVDLYRLEGEINVSSLGLPEIWENKGNLVIIEWAEKIKRRLPKNSLIIKFEVLGKNKRRIGVKNC